MKSFATATLLAEAHLSVNQFVETRGLSSEGDTGAARYYIIAPTTPAAKDVVLANGNIAEFKLAITPLIYPVADENQGGIVRRATQAEVNAGTDAVRFVSPATLKSAIPYLPAGTDSARGVLELATNSEALAGTDTERAVTPANVKYVLDNHVEYKNWSSIDVLIDSPSASAPASGPWPRPCVAAINEDTFVEFRAGNNLFGRITKYRYNKHDHSVTKLGESPQILDTEYAGITAIGQNRVVLVTEGSAAVGGGVRIRTYDWVNTEYVAKGSTLTIPNAANPAIVALNSTDVAIWYRDTENGDTRLASYRYNNGSGQWGLLGGTPYALGEAETHTGITALNPTTVVITVGKTYGERLQAMYWDSAFWVPLGTLSPEPPGFGAESAICAINSTDVVQADWGSNEISLWRFQNDTWSILFSTYRILLDIGFPAICALKENLFVLSDSSLASTEIYRINEHARDIPYRPY